MTFTSDSRPLLTPEEIADALGRPRPTVEQSAIISSPLTPRLVVAGAGSGKTATMVVRYVWLVANGPVRADQVLGVTFTRKAAGELRERMRSRLEELRRQNLVRQAPGESEEVAGDPVVSTYHSYANSLVSTYGLRIGIEDDAQMLGGAQAWQLVAQLVEHYDGKLPEKGVAKSTMTSAVLKLAAECAEHLVTPEQVSTWCQEQLSKAQSIASKPTSKGATAEQRTLIQGLELRIFYAELVQRYTKVKERMQVMDYGDLIAHAARIAREVPAAAETERERFAVVLLDEFQDTSHAQMQLFSDLFGARNGKPEHPVMAVGDPKQSIYGFRGASDGQLFSFYDFFPTSNRTASYLTVAWRNDSAILSAANTNVAPLAVQPNWVVSSHSIEVPDLVTRPAPGTGRVEVGEYLTDQDEARAIAARIITERAPFTHRPLEEMPTMAVLCKKRAQMEPIREACEELGVPYQVVGLGGLLDTPEIVDTVAVLRVLSDPGRSDALMRLLAGARWRIGVSDLLAFADWASALKQQREYEIRFGITAEAAATRVEQEALDELEEARQRGLQSQDEIKRLKEAESLDSFERYRRVLDAAAPDVSDGASLIEALENLPQPGWVSPRTGRSLSDTALARLQQLAGELAYLRQFTADDLTTLLFEIERTTLLDIELASRPGVRSHAARRHLDAFHSVAASYEASAPRAAALLLAAANGLDPDEGEDTVRFSLSAGAASASGVSGFLAWLDAAAAEENGLETVADAPRHDAVQLLTVHASKGLEWDHVYLPGMASGEFPDGKDERWTKKGDTLPWALRGDAAYLPSWRDDFKNLRDFGEFMAQMKEQAVEHRVAEERRLSYVGFTRARSLLVLTSSAWKGTGAKPRAMSQFLTELIDRAEELEGTEGQGIGAHIIASIDPHQVGQTNPQSATVLTALWPFDPVNGPEVRSWSSLEELEEAGREAALGGGAPPAGSGVHGGAQLTPRQVLEQAAANVLRGGLAPSDFAQAQQNLGELSAEDQAENARVIDSWQQETDLLLELLRAPASPAPFELPGHMSASLLVQ
ncbi:MAG: ATP-dependent helicase, partial [Rothia sp. (in: high G+C Gram-positive bacteria)]|nr:ATP-dependent helicase [Rothia sp. (in: high G+C Gram-positive bacteria)]